MLDPLSIGLMAGGSVLNGVLGLIGGNNQASAQEKSAQIQADAARRASELQAQQYQQTRTDLMPYMQAGSSAMGQLSGYLSDPNSALMRNFSASPYDPSAYAGITDYSSSGLPDIPMVYNDLTGSYQVDLASDPGYQFRLRQGLESINQGAGAQGRFFSGDTGKALMGYGQNLASQEYGNAYNRMMGQKQFTSGQYQNALNSDLARRNLSLTGMNSSMDAYGQSYNQDLARRQYIANLLSGVAGMGQNSATQSGSMGIQAATNIGNYNLAGAQAQGMGMIGVADSRYGGMQNLGNQLTGLMGTIGQYNLMDGIINPPKELPQKQQNQLPQRG